MSKLAPKISGPGTMHLAEGPMHIDGTQKGGRNRGGQLAQVKGTGTSPTGKGGNAGSFMPERTNAMANLTGPHVGQQNPNTAAAATKKPNRKGGAAFYGEM